MAEMVKCPKCGVLVDKGTEQCPKCGEPVKAYYVYKEMKAYYKGYSWCFVYEAETILPTLNELLNPYDMDLTAEDLDLPKASGYYFNH